MHQLTAAFLTDPIPLTPAQAAWLAPAAGSDALCCLVRCGPHTRGKFGPPCQGPRDGFQLAVAVLSSGCTQLCHPPMLQVRCLSGWEPTSFH